ncbi:MAG: DUF3015 family protein [Halobacteriovoraceae bacterium]|nr:DUF3015 family protein [Halobacteriovoraceae bacterium]
MKLILLLALLSPISLLAADGSSGCGPGWYIFKDNSILSSMLRATTNGLLFPVTTLGMTLGTSNCSKHKLVMREKESLHFAINNYFELKKEIASGEGQYISAFTETLGCRESISDQLGNKLKENYRSIFKSSEINPEELLRETYKIILTDKNIAKSCSDLV